MLIDDERTQLNVRAKTSMREYLKAKTWVQKVESIERMNVANKLAKRAMRNARAQKASSTIPAK